MKHVSISEFEEQFSEIMDQVRIGEKIAVSDDGQEIFAVVTPCTLEDKVEKGKSIKLGLLSDKKLTIHDDFEMGEEMLGT